MKASKRANRNYWIQVGVLAAVAAILIGFFIYSSTRPLDAHDLAVEVSDLRTLGAGAAQLTDAFASGDTTFTFFDNQLELMHDKASSGRDSLDSSEAEPEIEPDFGEAKRLAEQLDATFAEVAAGNLDARGDLRRVALSLKSLEDRLKQEAEK